MRRALILAALVAGAALLLAAAGSPRGIKEGGTFRIATAVNTIDPAFANLAVALEPACGMLMRYPDKPPPAGVRVAPDLAEAEPVVSRDGKTYTFTIREDARFSDGKPVTARAFVHALERILNPAMDSFRADEFRDIVGARKLIAGKATTLAGAVAKGKKLTLRLSRPVPDYLARMADLCVVPASLPADPEGAKAPLPSAAPYYVAEYVPGERLVLERNRFYRGERAHHVDRFVADLRLDTSAVDKVASGTFDYVYPFGAFVAQRADELSRRYGLNKSQFFVAPGNGLRVFLLNSSQPLFRKNPKLRQAVNYAVDRRALAREAGVVTGGVFVEPPTDQYLLPHFAGYRNTVSTRSRAPTCAQPASSPRASHAAEGCPLHIDLSGDAARAEILKRNLKAIGLELEVKRSRPPSRRSRPPGSRGTSAASCTSSNPTPATSTPSSTGGRSASPNPKTGRPSTRRSTTGCSIAHRGSPARSATGLTASWTCCSRGTPRPGFRSRAPTCSRSSLQESAASSSTGSRISP